MKRQFLTYIGIGIINLLLFCGVFSLLQSDFIYNKSLGNISDNYSRIGGWDSYEIIKVKKPYLKINESNVLQWDAAIYHCISKKMYSKGNECYGNVRCAFFPLFPFIWKLTGSSGIFISLFNYFIFILGISILLHFLLDKKCYEHKIIYHFLLITLPSTIIFYIPYTEALLFITMTFLVVGILKERYWIYFLSAFLLALVRPATIFILFGILGAEFFVFLNKKNIKLFFVSSIKKSIPFILGYFSVLLIQYLYTNSWNSMIEAHSYWSGNTSAFNAIHDWSTEGFGMNSLAFFFISIPVAIFFLFKLYLAIFNKRRNQDNLLNNDTIIGYLFNVSVIYIVGIFIFTLLTSGGNLHSYFRFILSTPLFYIFLLIIINELNEIQKLGGAAIFVIFSFVFFAILNKIQYTGNIINFSYVGMFLLLISLFMILTQDFIKIKWKFLLLAIIIILNIVWNTYMFNMYLSNAWIFT